MIDLDELQAAINRCAFDGDVLGLSKAECSDLLGRIRQAEKDAARYRWIKENSQLGVGRCGIDWELYFEGPAPDNSAMIELHIDEAMQCK